MAAGLLRGDARRQLHQTVGRNAPHLGVGAGWDAGVGHTVADGDLAHARADRCHHAGGFQAWRGRQRRQRVKPGAVIDVDEVQSDGFMPHQSLAGSGLPGVDLLPLQDLGSSMLMNADGLGHRCLLWLLLNRLFPNDLDQDSLAPAAVKFTVKDLFPRSKVKPALSHRHHHLAAHDLALHVRVGIVFPDIVPVLGHRLVGRELFSQTS